MFVLGIVLVILTGFTLSVIADDDIPPKHTPPLTALVVMAALAITCMLLSVLIPTTETALKLIGN